MRDKRAPIWNCFGGLGPDLDNPESQMKRVSRLRVADFSNQLREINKQTCKPLTAANIEKVQPSARKIAIEYSRSVPKPTNRAIRPLIKIPATPQAPSLFGTLERLLIEHGKLDNKVAEIRRKYDT